MQEYRTVEVNKRLREVIDHSLPCLYIPLALEPETYDDCYNWIKKKLRNIDVPYIDMVRSSDELVKIRMKDYGIVYIGGGNTFKLLKMLKKVVLLNK